MREDFFDGLKKFLGANFAWALGVDAGLWFGDSMLSIVIPPGLDSSPGELMGSAFFVFEDLFADADVAFSEAVSVGEFQRAEDFHFKIGRYFFHIAGELGRKCSKMAMVVWCCAIFMSVGSEISEEAMMKNGRC